MRSIAEVERGEKRREKTAVMTVTQNGLSDGSAGLAAGPLRSKDRTCAAGVVMDTLEPPETSTGGLARNCRPRALLGTPAAAVRAGDTAVAPPAVRQDSDQAPASPGRPRTRERKSSSRSSARH